jgi:hypothetical protein
VKTTDSTHPSIRLPQAVLALVALLAVAAIGVGTASAASSGGFGPGGSGGTGETSSDTNTTPSKYARMWSDKVTVSEKRWADRTADCESGGDPDAIGGDGAYRGAFQFMKSTWKRSPQSPGGDPIDYSYRTQAVVAVLLKRRDGASHWPVCG